MFMRNLACIGYRPAIGVVPGFTDCADFYAARISFFDIFQAIGAVIFFIPNQFD